MYNVVDSVFVSRFSMDGLTAVSTAFPIQNLMIGVFSGLGVGFNAFISKALGEKKFDRANEVARQGIFLRICDIPDNRFILCKDIHGKSDGGCTGNPIWNRVSQGVLLLCFRYSFPDDI